MVRRFPAANTTALANGLDTIRQLVNSESEEICDQFPDLLQCDGSDIGVGRFDDSIDADGCRQVRLGGPEPGDLDLGHPAS